MQPDDPRHGTNAGYIAHVFSRVEPCDACRDAGAAYQRERDKRRYFAPNNSLRIPSRGYQRRMQALVALGWPMSDLDAEMGRRAGTLSRWLNVAAPWIHEARAKEIAALYDRLSMQAPPDGWRKERAQKLARRNGWAPPLAWDDIDRDPEPRGVLRPTSRNSKPREFVDPVVVERVLAGDVVPASRAEKAEIVRRWAESGRSLGELERLTGWAAKRYYKKGEAA